MTWPSGVYLASSTLADCPSERMFLSLWPTYLLRTVLYLLSGWRGDKLWVPERSAVNRCRERFRRVEVRVLRRSYLISRAAYLYPSHSTACLFTSCTRVVPNQYVVLAVIQDPVPRTTVSFYLQNLDLPQALRVERKFSSRQLGLFFSFLVGPG